MAADIGAVGPAPAARLTESTLWKEDVLTEGHRKVWGSWYDADSKRWGYACCRGLNRNAACTLPPSPKASPQGGDAEGSDSGIEQTSPDSENMTEETPLDFSNPPPELLPSQAVEGGAPAAFIEHYVRFMLGAWRRQQEAGFPGFRDIERQAFQGSAAYAEAEKALTPLLWRLKKGDSLDRGEQKDNRRSRETRTSMEGKFVKEKSVLQQLYLMATKAEERDYMQAHEAYMHLTFGNKMWNLTHVAHVAACTMKGAREYRRNRDSLNTYDMDPVSQKYMWAFKKITHLCQCLRPSSDQSKNVVM